MFTSWGEGPSLEYDYKTYYRDVFTFTNRLRVLATIREAVTVRGIVDSCLRGKAE